MNTPEFPFLPVPPVPPAPAAQDKPAPIPMSGFWLSLEVMGATPQRVLNIMFSDRIRAMSKGLNGFAN